MAKQERIYSREAWASFTRMSHEEQEKLLQRGERNMKAAEVKIMRDLDRLVEQETIHG